MGAQSQKVWGRWIAASRKERHMNPEKLSVILDALELLAIYLQGGLSAFSVLDWAVLVVLTANLIVAILRPRR